MVRLKVSEFGAPKGSGYLGRFLGCTLLDDGKVQRGRDGKPMEPGMRWEWEITDDPDHDGAYVGVRVGRVTSQTPTAGNACGTLLTGLVGRKLDLNEEIDPDEYKGEVYRITIGTQRDNPEKTQVIQVDKVKTSAAPRNGPAPAAPPARTGPPPRPMTKQQAVRYWTDTGEGEPKLLSPHEVNAWLEESKVEPSTVAACVEGSEEWKTLADFGFKPLIPY